jgi:hypothetical protein
MAQRLTGDRALALLANAIATGGALVAILLIFGVISGAHLNPVVTLCMGRDEDTESAERCGLRRQRLRWLRPGVDHLQQRSEKALRRIEAAPESISFFIRTL